MKYRTLGKTGLKVSEVGFGAWAIGGNGFGNSYGPTDDKTSIDAVRKAVDLGCNFFDTADAYGHGHSEELIGKALKDNDDVVIATKAGADFYHDPPRMNFSPDYLAFALGKSLERLQTDHVDLYQLHNPPIQLLRDGKIFEGLERLVDSGKVHHYGVSIHDPEEGILAIKNGRPSTIQVVFNILRQEAKNRLFEAAGDNDVAIIAREPLSNGFLSGKFTDDSTFPPGDIRFNFPRNYFHALVKASRQLEFLQSGTRTLAQAAIRFVLDHREIATVIPGAKTPAQAEEDLRASELPSLTGEELVRIRILRERGFA
ncbi:aldo/keto reductase [Candidatus Bathyarchaeota archaeon]|nr:aldo/keto reductase [Candidatus Bathyarchaeota archaeon]